MRNRTFKNNPVIGHVSWDQTSPTFVHQADYYHVMKDIDILTDVVTPDFFARRARGEIIINPCYRFQDKNTGGGGSFTASDTRSNNLIQTSGNGSVTAWRLASYSNFTPSLLSGLVPQIGDESEAKLKALNKIDSTPYAMMEDLFEIKSILSGLKAPLDAAAKLAADFRKKRLKGKSVADAWLGTRYGFLPVVRSLSNIAEALHKGNRELTKPTRRSLGPAWPELPKYLGCSWHIWVLRLPLRMLFVHVRSRFGLHLL